MGRSSLLSEGGEKMRCLEVEEQLSSYIDGMLPEEKKREIEEHLNKCPRCREKLTQLQTLVAELKELPSLDPPADLVPKALMEYQNRRRKRVFSPVRRQVIAACLAGLLLLSGNVYFLRSNKELRHPAENEQTFTQESDAVSAGEKCDQAIESGNDEPQQRSYPQQRPSHILYFNLAAVPLALAAVYLAGKRGEM